MPKPGLVIVGFFAAVLGLAGLFQSGVVRGLLDYRGTHLSGCEEGSAEDLFATDAGWRFRKGQPSHWKYLVMRR